MTAEDFACVGSQRLLVIRAYPDRELHLEMDNYATHEHRNVTAPDLTNLDHHLQPSPNPTVLRSTCAIGW